jgi:hypothetical protein
MATQNQSGITSSEESSNSSFSPKDNRKLSSSEKKTAVAKHKTKATKNKDKKKRKTPAVGNESSLAGANSFAGRTSTSELHKKQKLQDDDTAEDDVEHALTTPEGQMAFNPKLTEDQAKAEAKREYNRRNAARARKRNKHMVGGLQEKINSLTKRTEDLERSNDMLQAQLEVLQTQNRDLLVSRKDPEPPKAQVQQSSSSNDVLSQLLEQLQGNNEVQQQQQQQPKQQQDITQLFNSLNGQGSTSQQQHSTLQSGPHGGNIFSAVQGQGNSQLLSALLSQNQAQPQIPYQQQQSSNQTGLQGQSMSHLLSTFGFQGQPQQQQQPQPQQYQQQSSQQVSGATQDQQQNLQQLLASMPPEALYNMLRKSS